MPIGAGEEYLGTLSMGRTVDAPRWNASEINAATTVASDLGRLLLEARLMERQRALNVELRDVNDYRRDMVLTLAHELRNPVSVLFSHLELLGLETHSEESSHSLEALDRAARRIEDMVADLMTLASVSDPDRGAPMGEVDLSDLVRETSDFLAPTGARAGVEMQTVVADDLVVDRRVGRAAADGLQPAVQRGEVHPRGRAGRDGRRAPDGGRGRRRPASPAPTPASASPPPRSTRCSPPSSARAAPRRASARAPASGSRSSSVS